MVIIVFFVVVSILAAVCPDYAKRARFREAQRIPGPNVSGAAHFSTDEDCKRGKLFSGKGIRIAFSKFSGRVLRYVFASHLLTVAPTGSGKARDLLIPAIVDLGRKSLFAVDPKGQLLAVCHKARLEEGPVFALNPFGILTEFTKGVTLVRYNPMAKLEANDRLLAMKCDKIADGLVMGGSHDTFFDEGAKDLLSGLEMGVVCHGTPEQKNLPTVCDILCGDVFGYCREVVAKTSNRYLAQRLGPYAARGAEEDRTLLALINTARVNTKFIRNEVISESLSGSDFSFSQLRQMVCTLFLVLPLSSLEICDRYFRLIVAAALSELLTEESLGSTGVLCVLDEAAQLGRLGVLEKAVAMARGFGVQFWSVFTDLPQMEKLYGQGYRTFVANSGCRIFMAPNDTVTAEELSKLAGQTEVISQSTSVSFDFNGEPRPTYGASQQARALLLPHEVRELDGDEMLIFCDGVKGVIRAKRKPYFKMSLGKKCCPDPYEQGKHKSLFKMLFGGRS